MRPALLWPICKHLKGLSALIAARLVYPTTIGLLESRPPASPGLTQLDVDLSSGHPEPPHVSPPETKLANRSFSTIAVARMSTVEKTRIVFLELGRSISASDLSSRVTAAIILIMALFTAVLFYNGLQIHVWRQDDFYYVTQEDVFVKLKSEGRWLSYVALPILQAIPGAISWITGLLLFAFFIFVSALNVTSDRFYSAIVAALCLQSIPLYLVGFWPAATLPSYVLLGLATLAHKRTPLPIFYLGFGCLFLGGSSQYYYLLPLLHLGTLTNSGRLPWRKVLLILTLWAAGFIAGFLLLVAIEKFLTGVAWPQIADWRQPHYVRSVDDAIINIRSRLQFLGAHFQTVFQNVLVGAVIAGAALLRSTRSNWRYEAAAIVVSGAIVLAHYIITTPLGIVIEPRTIVATFVGILSFVFIAPGLGPIRTSLMSACALVVFLQYWTINNNNIIWYRTVTSSYTDELVRLSPLPPQFYGGLIVEGGDARSLEERIDLANRLKSRYAEILSEPMYPDWPGDRRWAVAAQVAGFRSIVFCPDKTKVICTKHLDAFQGNSCESQHGMYCVRGVTPNNFLVISFNVEALAKPEEKIDFTATGVGAQLLASGWSQPEDWGTWSNRAEARILMPVTSGTNSLLLELNAFVTPKHPTQHVEIAIDGTLVTRAALSNYHGNKVSVPIPKSAREMIDQNGYAELKFRFADAVRPNEIGAGSDSRLLAIGIEAITSSRDKVPYTPLNGSAN